MTSSVTNDIELRGCTPEPLMSYLKALGILRLIYEQKDRDVRGWWKNEVFQLRTRLSFDEVVKFFVYEYKPTPIVAPWAKNSGFFELKYNEKFALRTDPAVQAIANSKIDRLTSYREVIRQVSQILDDTGVFALCEKKAEQAEAEMKAKKSLSKSEVIKKIKDSVSKELDKWFKQEKSKLLRRCRRELPDDVVSWMDVVVALQSENKKFSPLLGTGGNDGHLNFTLNFMQRIEKLVLAESEADIFQSEDWLKAALVDMPATLVAKASVGQFAPGRVGGPNSTQGLEGDALDNPWDFVLAIEGAIFFAGSVVRRYGVCGNVRSSFPFTVDVVSAGFSSSAAADEGEEAHGEMWLPIWSRPAAVNELAYLFGEGRADVSGRPAQTATDFARAVAELGVDRGISSFTRYGFLKRNGRSYLAMPLGRWSVVRRTGMDLLREADSWLNAFRKAAKNKGAPPRYGAALRRIANAIFDFCKYVGPHYFQNVLVSFGNAERELALEKRVGSNTKQDQGSQKEQIPLNPLTGLSCGWLQLANDQTPEFKLAQAIAFINDPEIGPLRSNLEPVDWVNDCRVWAKKGKQVVWTAADLTTNLVHVLERRLMDGAIKGCANLPIHSKFFASLEDIAAFLDNRLDFYKIESLIWGMILVNPPNPETEASGASDHEKAMPGTLIPRDYALLKLLFLPRPLVADRKGQKISWRLANSNEDGIRIRQEPRILTLLRAGRIGEACALAAYRLRVSGLTPMPGPTADGRRRDWVWSYEGINPRRGIRLAAALLIPISDKSVNQLVNLVCRPTTAEELASMNVVMQGDNQ